MRIAIILLLIMIFTACTLPASRTPMDSGLATTLAAPVSATPPPATHTPVSLRTQAAIPTRTPTSAPASPTLAASPSAASPAGVQLARIQRIDALHGWAQTWNDWMLLRTPDGGRTWQAVNPPGVQVTHFFALDANQAWTVEQNTDPQAQGDVVHRTADGGESWESFPAPFFAAALQMLDDRHGWAFGSQFGCAAGTCFIDVYRTEDSGETWMPVSVDNPLNPGLEPFFAGTVEIPSGMALRATGQSALWLSGTLFLNTTHGRNALFYTSQDAGASWTERRVAMPASAPPPAIPAYVSAPRFIDPQTGVFWAWYVPDARKPEGVYAFFYTADGGVSWSARPGLVPAEYYTAPVDVVSAQVIFVRCLEALCVSRDGARTWARVDANLAFIPDFYPSLADFDFIDPERGWAIIYTSEMESALFASEDGGRTWTALPADIQGRP